MKQLLVILFLSSSLMAQRSNELQRSEETFYMPAEWEPHDAVWFGWPRNDSSGYFPAIVKMIKALAPNIPVKIAFANVIDCQKAKDYLGTQGIDSTMYKTYVMPGTYYWIRDHGAIFLVNGNGQLGVSDFGWSGCGKYEFLLMKYEGNTEIVNNIYGPNLPGVINCGKVDSMMAILENANIVKTEVIHEGGAIEVNGEGTLILCEATVLSRNPGLTKKYLEKEFKRVLGVTNIIWLKQGLAQDPLHFFRRISGNYVGGGTGGHTDEFVRFANANTILLAWIDENEKDLNPVNRMNYLRMKENYRILKNSKDQSGKAFKIIKVPLPDLIVQKISTVPLKLNEHSFDVTLDQFISAEMPKLGDTLLRVAASSYLNYFVTNGLVFLPTYQSMGSSKEKEETVQRIFEKYFPDRKIVFVDVMAQNWWGGGMHCSTQQQPKRKVNKAIKP